MKDVIFLFVNIYIYIFFFFFGLIEIIFWKKKEIKI